MNAEGYAMPSELQPITSTISTAPLVASASRNDKDPNDAAIIDAGLEMQPLPRSTATSSFVNLPAISPPAEPAVVEAGFFSAVRRGVTHAFQTTAAAIQNYIHPPQEPVAEVQVALRGLSQSAHDPLFPESIYVHGQLNYSKIEEFIAKLSTHYRATTGASANDQVGQFLDDMPVNIARRVQRQLRAEQQEHLLTVPANTLTRDQRVRLDRAMLCAVADKWTSLNKLIAATVVQESIDHDLVGLTLTESHVATASQTTSRLPNAPVREAYLHELQHFCKLQTDYVRAINMPNTVITAGHDLIPNFDHLRDPQSPLTPAIGTARVTQRGGGVDVGLAVPVLGTIPTPTQKERSILDLGFTGNATYSQGNLWSTDTDNDFNYSNVWSMTGKTRVTLATPVVSANLPGEVTQEYRTYYESLNHDAAYAAALANTAYQPTPTLPQKIAAQTSDFIGMITAPFLGGPRRSPSLKAVADYSMATHNGVYAIPAMHRSAAALDAMAPSATEIRQSGAASGFDLRGTLSDMLPTPAARMHASGPIEPNNPNLNFRQSTQIPFSVPATPSARTDPSQAASYPWSVQTFSGGASVTTKLTAAQFRIDPLSNQYLKVPFAPSGTVSAIGRSSESVLPLTRLNVFSGKHPDSFPEQAVVAASQVIQTIVERTTQDSRVRPSPAFPFGDVGALHLMNKHFPRDVNGQPLVDVTSPLYEVSKEADPYQFYSARDAMHPAFQHLLQALELHVGSKASAGLSPARAFQALQESYKKTSEDYAEVAQLIRDAKSASSYGSADTEDVALQRIKHIVFHDAHCSAVTSASTEKDKNDLCLLAVQMFDLQFNMLDRMFEMAKANHGAMEQLYGAGQQPPDAIQALHATQLQRDCSCEHFEVETADIPRVHVARSHLLAADTASIKKTKGVNINATIDLGARDALNARSDVLKNWVPGGNMLGSGLAQFQISGNIDFADQHQHPAWHREALRTDVVLDLKLNGSVVGVPIAVMAAWLTESCMSSCQGMDDETALQELGREMKEFFTETLSKQGGLSLLNAGHGLRLELRLERPHPENGELTVNKLAFKRFGELETTDKGLKLFPDKLKKLASVVTSAGTLSFDPQYNDKTSEYRVKGSHVGDGVRAALTMYPRLLSIIQRTPTSGINFQTTAAEFQKPEHKPALQMWFGGKNIPFVSIIADALKAEERAIDSQDAPSGNSELEYALQGPSVDARTSTRATFVKPVYDQYRANKPYAGAAAPVQSNFTKLGDILDQLSTKLLGRPYSGAPDEKQALLVAISNSGMQQQTANNRLAYFTRTPAGQAILQAADRIMALAGSYSTTQRLGNYYQLKPHNIAIDHFFPPQQVASQQAIRLPTSIEVNPPLPLNSSPEGLSMALAREDSLKSLYLEANQGSGELSKMVPSYHPPSPAGPPPPTTVMRRIVKHPIIPPGAGIHINQPEPPPLVGVVTPQTPTVVTTIMRENFGAERLPDYGDTGNMRERL